MPQVQDVKGEAVRQRALADCEPLKTQEMGYHPAEAGRVNKMKIEILPLRITKYTKYTATSL